MTDRRPDFPYDAVLLVSFGGPEGPDDVIPFLQNVTAGRNVPVERLAEVGEQYAHFGGRSPINDQCRRQRDALATALRDAGLAIPVYWGNRNWDPFIVDAVEEMANDGVTRALAVFTSAYSSYSGCRQYRENLSAAREAVAQRRPDLKVPAIDKVRAYYDHPGFIQPFIDATIEAAEPHVSPPLLMFTAHSIPTSMAAACDYEAQLRVAAQLVTDGVNAARGESPELDHVLVWQSRSGPPQVPWLEPDVNLALTDAAGEVANVVIVPVGFVSDHMEVMWDLDTQAAETAAQHGITVTRAVAPGTAPQAAFIDMWVDLIIERGAAETTTDPNSIRRAALGPLDVRPDVCRVDCCPAPSRPGRARPE